MDNIKQTLGKQSEEILKQFLDEDPIDSFLGNYTGKVVDNNDPEKLGRCKIRIYGVFDIDVPNADLPWALPDNSFVGSKVGSFIVPPIDTIVRVYFENGEIYLPHYSTKVLDKNNLPPERLVNYPDNMILFKTDSGDILEVNRQTGTVKFTHNSNTSMEFKRDGSCELKKPGVIDGAFINIKPNGEINIESSLLGAINIGGSKAILYCPDLQVCPITGAPLSVGTKLPGQIVKVP